MNPERVAALEEMLKENPQDAFCMYALALEFAGSPSHREKALGLLLGLRSLHPDYLPLYYQLAVLLKNADRLGEAREVLERGLGLAAERGDRHTAAELNFLLDEID